MISEKVKNNWVEVALKQWDILIQDGTISLKGKPNRQLLTGLIGLIFSHEKLLASGQNWVDLSSVTSVNFFTQESKNLILKRFDKSLVNAGGIRRVAYDCLKRVYEEGFDIDKAILKHPIATSPRAHQKKPVQYDLVEEWQKAVFAVFNDDPKFDGVNLPETEAVQSRIESIIGALEKEFGTVSYKRFVTDDIMDATDDLLAVEIKNAKTASDLFIAQAIEIAATRLPVPKR